MTVRAPSPSQTALSESKLNQKALCDYVVNVADGCSHGCEFCYVPSMPAIWGDPGDKFADAGIDDPADEWGDYALYRDDVVENTARDCQRILPDDWRVTRRGQGVVGISFSTDCYMDRRAAELTRGVVETLVGHDRAVRILTRNPKLLSDLHYEFYRSLPEGSVTIGSSIPTLDHDDVRAIEPGAPHVGHRVTGLMTLPADVPTFVSMSPTYPTQDADDLESHLAELQAKVKPTVVFHEPINPRSGNIERCVRAATTQGRDRLARQLERLTDRDEWRQYALRQLRDVQVAAERLGQRVHLWPDSDLAENAPTEEQREWCEAWRERPSPEEIGDGPACREPYPRVPEISHQERLFGGERRVTPIDISAEADYASRMEAVDFEIPMNEWSRERLREGEKTATTRTKAYGEPGDRFAVRIGALDGVEERVYELTHVVKLPLEVVALHFYEAEGAASPAEFKEVWCDIHHRKGYDPTWRVHLHLFREVE